MATITPTVEKISDNCFFFSYEMGDDDEGAPIGDNHQDFTDRTVQISGTFGGATVTVEGSNDEAVAYATLNDLQGVTLSKTDVALEGIAELPRFTRPKTAGGTASEIVVTIIARRIRSGLAV
jgi:hypothetical protein